MSVGCPVLSDRARGCSASLLAQSRRPRADITPLVADGVRAGGPARVAVKVVLPEGLHTQSNKPRDPNLIPTELTIDAPAGVTVDEIVFPKPTDFKLKGSTITLARLRAAIRSSACSSRLRRSVPNGELKSGALPLPGVRHEGLLRADDGGLRMVAGGQRDAGGRRRQRRRLQNHPFGTGERGSKVQRFEAFRGF